MVVASHVRIGYTVTIFGPNTSLSIAALMAPSAVPPPVDELANFGVSVSTDTTATAAGPPATASRTLTLNLVEAATATATATRDQSANSGPITALTLTANGSGYFAPPIVHVTETAPGEVPTIQAIAHATLDVVSATSVANGTGYTVATVTFVGGGLVPGGVQATGHATIVGTAITAVTVDTPGGPYRRPPKIVITGDGSGAQYTAVMQVGNLVLDNPGEGYVSPAVSIVGLFKSTWPDGGPDQRQPFYNLLTNALQTATATKVVAATPVLLP